MKIHRQIICMHGDLETLHSQLSDKNILVELFTGKIDQESSVEIQSISSEIISGVLRFLYVSEYFQIKLEKLNTANPQTQIHLTISDNPFEHTPKYQKQLEKQTRNNNKLAVAAAITLIAIFIPTGILSMPYLTDESLEKSHTHLSATQQQLATAQQYQDMKEPQTALTIYETARQSDPDNIESINGVRSSLAQIQPYETILRDYDSLLVIAQDDSDNADTLQVSFYPEGINGPEILIPRTNPGDTPSISLESITKNTIPAVVYPTDSAYPAVVYPENLGSAPQVMPVDSVDVIMTTKEKDGNATVVIPGQMTHENAKFVVAKGTIPQEYHLGPGGPYVIYPYGISATEDLPALVFPQRMFYPLMVIPNQVSVYDQQPEIPYVDITFENEIVDQSALNSLGKNIPVRIFPDGPDSQPVEYPAGLDYTEIVSLPPISEEQIDNYDIGGLEDGTKPYHLTDVDGSFRESVKEDDTVYVGIGYDDPALGSPVFALPFTPDLYEEIGLEILPDGDPFAFAIDGEACTIRREMGSHDSTFWKLNLYTTNPPIMLNMNRSLCDGTYILGIDRDNSGTLDSGYEILWLRGYDAFDILHNIDYYEGVHDGVFDENDPLWMDALVMDSDYNYYHPEDLAIKKVDYLSDVQRFEDDRHGVGVYADDVAKSDRHFRIMAYSESGITFENGSTTELFGIVQGPLWDCTIHDVRYHVAEKKTGLYLRTENPEDPTRIYVDALDFCDDFEAAHKNPGKYLAHWIAGIASMEHKKGLKFSDYSMLEQSKTTYEKALSMAPSNPFFNSDYCLVNHQLGHPTDGCLPKVLQAIEDRPDVGWFADVYRIIAR